MGDYESEFEKWKLPTTTTTTTTTKKSFLGLRYFVTRSQKAVCILYMLWAVGTLILAFSVLVSRFKFCNPEGTIKRVVPRPYFSVKFALLADR